MDVNKEMVPTPNPMNTSAESIEAKERREALWKEILYRREKQWKIFSWTTSLLLAAIAGVVATTTKEGFELSLSHKVILAITLLLLFLYAVIWLSDNIRREEQATTLIKRIDADFGIGDIFRARLPF
jgi:FtsH-binding integral membrane protein